MSEDTWFPIIICIVWQLDEDLIFFLIFFVYTKEGGKPCFTSELFFIGSESGRRTNKLIKEVSQHISYMINIIKDWPDV